MNDMMLNEVTNILTIFGKADDVKDVMSTILTKKELTFKNILPMPEEIYLTMSPSKVVSQERYEDWKEETKESFILNDSAPITGEMQTELFFKYGVDNWKDWCIKFWGTIRDVMDTVILDKNKIKFTTGDSTPFEVMIRLSVMFPRVTVKVEYADEDIGVNVGMYKLDNGEVTEHNQPLMASVEAYTMAIDITGDTFYIEEFLHDMTEDDALEEFPEQLIKVAYLKRSISKFLPTFILENFRAKAVKEEDYEFASEVKKAIEEKIVKI